MLPMLAGAALYLRYRHTLAELKPGRAWDIALWLSGLAMLITGIWTVVTAFLRHLTRGKNAAGTGETVSTHGISTGSLIVVVGWK